jgi:lactoylglutathione lyase
MLEAIWHFSFTVSDLARSVAFYHDMLGMEFVKAQEQANAYTRRFVGFPDAHLRVAQLRLPGTAPVPSEHVLELVQYLAPVGHTVDTRLHNPGTAHLAFAVTDLWTNYERLKAQGVRFRSEPVAITEGVNAGGYTVYLLDPDDITLELVQPPPHLRWPAAQSKQTASFGTEVRKETNA